MQFINQVYTRAGLTQDEIDGMSAFTGDASASLPLGASEFYDSSQFEKLYEYLAFTIAVMPYGAAKGKTETPDEWILQFIDSWSHLATELKRSK